MNDLEIRWEAKCKLLSYVIVNGLPTDGDELKKMNENVFGLDCIFEVVDRERKIREAREKDYQNFKRET